MIPSKLGPYLLEEVLGRGGMGTVYRGVDPETNERVAVKILAPDLADDAVFLERFQEEVQTLIELKHPNIVQLLSFGKQGDVFYFAMELVEGKSLYAMQKAGHHFTYIETVEIGIKVCEALQYSHNIGVIHRDLKPGNIIRSADGQIKLADYGIAKRFGAQQMTMSGVMGTAEFMSPEQAMGKPATIQSDLYSLGGVLFALATGKPPIVGATPQKTLEKVCTTKAPFLTDVAKDAPEELGLLIAKLLKKQPENRLRSARSVATRLSEILEILHQRAEMETNLVVPGEEELALAPLDGSNPTMVDPRSTGAGKAAELSKSSATRPQTGKSAVPRQNLARNSGETLREEGSAPALTTANRVIREQNYFERAVRATEQEATEKPSLVGTVLLALGLVVLLSVSGYLVYDRVIRPRTADELWVLIEPAQERPMAVMQQLEMFLEQYPDDERASEVKELKAKAEAIQFRNGLALKSKLNKKDMTDLEKQFLKWTDDDHESKWDKQAELQALITYHRAGETPLSEQAQECLAAAEVFRKTYLKQALPEIDMKAKEINSRILAADRLEGTDPEQAAEIRQSLVDLFGNKEWAKPLIDPLRKRLEEQGGR
ncbi:MAG: serine/threonine protein kinase [Planctomycetaceae bacterium]|nr:serine/threonine protein kinase [Planctomycetaceae bacterium]